MNVMAHMRRGFLSVGTLLLSVSGLGCVDNSVSVKNTPPEVVFSNPADGEIFREREQVFLSATVRDKEDPMINLQVQWEISPDGDLQGEQTISGDQVNLDLGEFLDPGDYAITLTVIDPRGDNGSDTVNFTVKPNEPPTASLLVPEENDKVVFGGAARVFLQVEDPDEHDLNDLELQWGGAAALGHPPSQPNSDGSAEFYLLDLDLGLYSLDVTVIDALGATASDSVVFEVVYGDKDNDGFIDVALGGDDCDDFDEAVTVNETKLGTAHARIEDLEMTASEMFDQLVKADLSPDDSRMVEQARRFAALAHRSRRLRQHESSEQQEIGNQHWHPCTSTSPRQGLYTPHFCSVFHSFG